MTSVYVKDNNSRRVFGKLNDKFENASEAEVIEELLTFLEHENALTRWKAMRLLTYYNYSDSRRIRDFSEKESRAIDRQIVLEAIKNLPEEEAFALAMDIARFDDSPSIRGSALKSMQFYSSEWNRPRIVKVLMEALSDNNGSVRAQAIRYLHEMGVQQAVEKAPRLLLRDEDNSVRVAAGELLADMGALDSFSQGSIRVCKKTY